MGTLSIIQSALCLGDGIGAGERRKKKPIMLDFRSSDGFIIWVVAVAWFTVRLCLLTFSLSSLYKRLGEIKYKVVEYC